MQKRKLINIDTLKSHILKAYNVQVDCLVGSESDSYDKNHMKDKANELVRLHEVMKGKLKTVSYSEKIKFFPWYL